MNVEINGIDLYESIREHCEVNVQLNDYGWVVLDRQECVETSDMWFIDENDDEIHFTIDDVISVEI